MQPISLNSLKIMVLFLFVSVTRVECHANDNDLDESVLKEVSEKSLEIGHYILAKDVNMLLKFVHIGGVFFIDGHFTKQEIQLLLSEEDSWLYRHLFSGQNSILRELQSEPLAIAAIYKRGEQAVLVQYATNSNITPIENCLIELEGVWYFDGIFDCN